MYKAGDIVLVKMHPSSSTELKRYRPCVIAFDQVDPRFYTIAPLTSQANLHSPKIEFIVKPTSKNNLEKPSLLMCWYLETIGIKRVQKNIGTLDKEDYQSMKRSLKHILRVI